MGGAGSRERRRQGADRCDIKVLEMSDIPAKLGPKEMAEEDIHSARRDRELIKALRRRRCQSRVEWVPGAPTSQAAEGPRRR